ncbi:MAG: hypothetical protein WC251_02950 [Candidatus Izemoplasmatales bacterium]|jgi:hypothetical protein
MAKHRDIISYYLKHFPKIRSDFLSARDDLERNLNDTRNHYLQEVEAIKANYDSFENNHAIEYHQQEADYNAAVAFITDEYDHIFKKLDEDLEQNQKLIEQQSKAETDDFNTIMNQINTLRQEAYQKYLELTEAVNKKIDHEMKVHKDFINQEDAVLTNIYKEYHELNSQQANRLLWTIEQSRNALETLAKELQTKSMNEVAYMNEAILNVLESLRDTKNRITVLFKSTSDLFQKQKQRIQKLDLERQKPHSQLNQIIIRQYVKQIRDVNHKKSVFEQMIKNELKESLAILGQRIIEYDASGNKLESERAILQYEIVQKKGEYLLHKNQSMSDLLISKYQNEIKKIKIDSFKRVEEIKLAYYMPAAFYQNSINLYSNFAFYTRESFDELDNLLSSLIEYNNQLSDTKSDYISLSAKTVEDYKIKVMVHVNSVTSKLTDLVSKIDDLSKKIITLESENQLEIAEIRKKMESVDISGDYQKYIAGLENDEYMTCYQHDINMQKLRSEGSYQESLLLIEQTVNQIHKDKAVLNSSIKHLLASAASEKKIRDLAFDKELALFYAQHSLMQAEQETKEKLETQVLNYHFFKYGNLLARGYESLRQKQLQDDASGASAVVDYIHKTQALIDYNDADAEAIRNRVENLESNREYAYYLEKSRAKIIKQIETSSSQRAAKSERALILYNNHFYTTLYSIQQLFDNHVYLIKRQLVQLNRQSAQGLAEQVSESNAFLRVISLSIEKAFNLAEASLIQLRIQSDLKSLSYSKEKYFANYAVLADKSLKKISRFANKPKKLHNTLLEFYIESIKLIEQMLSKIRMTINSAELSIIKNDVLLIEKNRDQTSRTITIINREFDRLVYDAVRTGKRKAKQIEAINKKAEYLNDIFKDKVKEVNEAYLSQTKLSQSLLEYVKNELGKTIQTNEKALAMQLKSDKKRFLEERKLLEKRQNDFLKIYENFKQHSESLYREETEYIENSTLERIADFDKSLLALDRKVISLPEETKAIVKQVDIDKKALVEKRKLSLNEQFAAIESQKFTSHPKYIETIEAIRKRLPSDYLELYKQIQIAENEFLSEFHNTELAFNNDFKAFLKDQAKYNAIINNDNLPLKPFDSFLNFQEYIYQKTDQAFQETIAKSAVTKQMIADEEQRMKDKEKRIIG